MKKVIAILLLFASFGAKAQKIDSIYFNLYTDSLKKGVHNYINVDAKMHDGSYLPLMTDEVIFSSSVGRWEGNSLIIDSSFTKESVSITVKLKSNPSIVKNITVYIKKKVNDERLPTEQEVLDAMRKNKRKT